MHVAVGFMPAFKYRQKNSLIVLERGRKAHGYVAAGDASKVPIGCPQMTTRLSATADRRYSRTIRVFPHPATVLSQKFAHIFGTIFPL